MKKAFPIVAVLILLLFSSCGAILDRKEGEFQGRGSLLKSLFGWSEEDLDEELEEVKTTDEKEKDDDPYKGVYKQKVAPNGKKAYHNISLE